MIWQSVTEEYFVHIIYVAVYQQGVLDYHNRYDRKMLKIFCLFSANVAFPPISDFIG